MSAPPLYNVFNDPKTSLASNVTSTGATTITVLSSTGYPSGACQFPILVDAELMLVTNVSGTTWTVTRGIESTTATTHSVTSPATPIIQPLTAKSLPGIINQSNWNLLSPEDRVRAGGNMASVLGKDVSITAGASQTIVNYSSGPGYMSYFWLDFGVLTSGQAQYVDIEVTVDGTVIYNGPQMYFFGAPYWTDLALPLGNIFSNDYINFIGGQETLIPIPFGSSLLITVTNNYSGTITAWWTLQYVTNVVAGNWGLCNNLKIAQAGLDSGGDTSLSLTQDQVGTLVNATGLSPGRLFGILLVMQGFSASSDAFLEGNVQIYLDGTLAYKSSGLEDYVGMSGYFVVAQPGSGNRFKTLIAKRASPPFYVFVRFHVPDPMLFQNALEVKVQMGDSSSGNTFTGAVLLGYQIWYYTS